MKTEKSYKKIIFFLLICTLCLISCSPLFFTDDQGKDNPAANSETPAESPTPASLTPSPEGPTPSPEGPTPSPEGPTPSPEGPTPSPEGPTPSPEGPTPSPEGPTPSPAGPTPSPAGPTPSPADPTPSPEGPTPEPAGGAIIADHTIVDDYKNIPAEYLNKVKTMLISLTGQSHSWGYLYGLNELAEAEPLYAVDVIYKGAPSAPRSDALRVINEIYITGTQKWGGYIGEEGAWTSDEAITGVKNHMDYVNNTLNNPMNVFAWAWCYDMVQEDDRPSIINYDLNPDENDTAAIDPVYQVHWYGRSVIGGENYGPWGLDNDDSALTGNTAGINLNDYLAAVESFNSHSPETAAFFTTGTVEGSGNGGERGYQRWLKNEAIRQHVKDNGGFLFDYADILCWNNEGEQSVQTWTDHGGTGQSFQGIHPDNSGSYSRDGLYNCHIGKAGTIRLAKALWWILARQAGWNP